MKEGHAYLTKDITIKVNEYSKKTGLNFSQSARRLIEIGLNSTDENQILKENNVLLEKIFSRQIYIRDLIEQFYSDMEIEKLSNPRNNKALQKFKTNKDKIKYDE